MALPASGSKVAKFGRSGGDFVDPPVMDFLGVVICAPSPNFSPEVILGDGGGMF